MLRGGKKPGLVLAGLIAALLVAAPAGQAAPGDVYAVDWAAGSVWRLGPNGGDASLLTSDFDGGGDIGGIALGPDGALYVGEQDGDIYRVSTASGATTNVADIASPPDDLAFDARGRLLVVDRSNNDVLAVNPGTGSYSPIYDGPGANNFGSIAVALNGAIFLGGQNDDKVTRVLGGTATPVLENDPDLDLVGPLELTADQRFLYVSSVVGMHVFRLDLRTGAAIKFPTPSPARGVARLPSGRVLVSGNARIDIFGPTGSAPGNFSNDADLDRPSDMVVEPKRCAGRIPGLVGTNARDVIRGSPFADVVSTLGGRDTVKGLGGNDIVCGGGARDRLIGGKGRDRLLGGGGNDLCRGGPGRDALRAC